MFKKILTIVLLSFSSAGSADPLHVAANAGHAAFVQALQAHAAHLAIVNANLLDQIIKQQRHHFWR